MERFRSGATSALVATDVAARGIDIPEVDLVVHFRLPDQNESYLHRSGRTGRAGRSGRVVVLYGPRERRELETLERDVKRNLKRINGPTPEEVMTAKWAGLARRLSKQPAADRALWMDFAQRLVAEEGVGAVAGMMAMVLGGAPVPKSLITGEELWTTVKLAGTRITINRAVAVIKGAGAGDIGRIRLDADTAAYVDIRPEDWDKLDHSGLRDLKLSRAAEIPSHIQAGSAGNRSGGGRPSQGRSQGQGGGGRKEHRSRSSSSGSGEKDRKRIVFR
jgi:ATP-dependent RNA helicase DeaD